MPLIWVRRRMAPDEIGALEASIHTRRVRQERFSAPTVQDFGLFGGVLKAVSGSRPVDFTDKFYI